MRNAISFTNRNDSVEKFEDPKQTLEERQQTIKWLQLHNYPALPVAPAQSTYEYHKVVQSKPEQGIWQHCPLTADLQPIALYTGKNPSYLDAKGVPHLVNHRSYQKRLPDSQELNTWFANPANGVGTLGGWNNTVWLDFDVKQFPTQEECDAAVLKILERPELQQTFIERTHSSGWRIGVRVKHKPDFTNFSLTLGGTHVGEALFEGRFTVLAPTIGPSLNPYQSLNRALPVEVESLESIGIYPTSTKRQRPCLIPPPALSAAIPGSIPLEMLGHDESQEILRGANLKGDRSDSLTTALNEWYGWYYWARDNGIAVSGTPIELAHYAGQRLGLDSDRIDRILKSVNADVSLTPAALMKGGESSCWKKIRRLDRATFERQCPAHIKDSVLRDMASGLPLIRGGSGGDGGNRRGGGAGSGSGDGGDGDKPKPQLSLANLADRIREILHRYDSESLQAVALMELAHSYALPYSNIEKLASCVRLEDELTEEVREAIKPLRSLLGTCRKRLDLHRYLAKPLADALVRAAMAMPTAPEYLLNTLIPVAASRIGVSSRVVIKPESGYVQPCIFWTGNVAHSGQAKTPPQALIMEALEDMEEEAREAYQLSLADWEANQDKNKGKKPVEPRRILNNVTMAQKIRIHGENPRGLLEYIDELVADFERHNQHKGGKGDDLQQELQLWGSKFGSYDRGDVRLYLRRTAISKTGTYQWDTLARLMADEVNFIQSGYMARFLLCSIVDAPDRKLDLLSPHQETGLKDLLRRLYRQLELLPEQDYLLSREAKILFQALNHLVVELEKEEPHFSLSLVYAKIESDAARLALWLHIVNAVVKGEEPAPVISGETMQAAIELAAFYLWQHKLIHAHNAPTRMLEGIFLKTQTLAEKLWSKGKALTASFAKSRINPLKNWVSDKIRDKVFRFLVANGFGRVEGEGEKMVYIPNTQAPNNPSDNIFTIGDFGAVGASLVMPPTDETTLNQLIQTSVGEIGDLTNTSYSAQAEEMLTTLEEATTCGWSNTKNTNQEAESLDLVDNIVIGDAPSSLPTVGDGLEPSPDDEPDPPPSLASLRASIAACAAVVSVPSSSQKEHSKTTVGEEVAQLPQPGDTVQILSGELAGQQGLVHLVDDTVASVQLSGTQQNFSLHELHLVERCQLKVGKSVFVNSCPHTDKHGPYEIQSIDGAYAKVEMFGKLLLLADLRLAP
jgi:hypothetical protein